VKTRRARGSEKLQLPANQSQDVHSARRGVGENRLPCARTGHESLDVTLAYLKGKDAESEEAQEHANSSSLALYA
jgi:hypothetical protein